jgi:hypothetical protein
MRSQPPDCFLSFAEVAMIIGIDEGTIRNGDCGTDELLRIKRGSRTLFSFNDVQAWIAKYVGQARDHKSEIAAITLLDGKTKHLQRRPFNKAMALRIIK